MYRAWRNEHWVRNFVLSLKWCGSRDICFWYSKICHSWSQWPCGLRPRSAAVRLLRLWVRIPPEAWMSVSCDCCALSGRGLCDELITRPEESYRLWCVVVCDLETSWMRRPWPNGGSCAIKKYSNKVTCIKQCTSYMYLSIVDKHTEVPLSGCYNLRWRFRHLNAVPKINQPINFPAHHQLTNCQNAFKPLLLARFVCCTNSLPVPLYYWVCSWSTLIPMAANILVLSSALYFWSKN